MANINLFYYSQVFHPKNTSLALFKILQENDLLQYFKLMCIDKMHPSKIPVKKVPAIYMMGVYVPYTGSKAFALVQNMIDNKQLHNFQQQMANTHSYQAN